MTFRLSLQKGVRHLDHHAGAVAGIRLYAACAAMGHVRQDLQSLFENAVGLFAVDVDDHSHPASIMLELRIIQTLSRG